MVKISNKKVIELRDWNNLVEETYKRTYNLQQQNGCMERELITINIPELDYDDPYKDVKSIPEVVNGDEMGVRFESWLSRDPEQWTGKKESWTLNLWWERNFYPDLQIVANDLHKKGLIEAGEYSINIDW